MADESPEDYMYKKAGGKVGSFAKSKKPMTGSMAKKGRSQKMSDSRGKGAKK